MSQSTSRTKRRKLRAQQAEASATRNTLAAASPSKWLAPWLWAVFGILAAAAVLRLLYLDLKPLHHDEGVNGLFLATLFRSGYYHYDPSNFHGPTLYYFGWITTTINSFFYGKGGLSTFAIRLVTVLFGLGIIWLLLCLRRQLGNFGALAAATLAAVSPGMVFFSRYFIHEVLFVFFSLGVVVATLRFRETTQPRYLILASLSAALLCATKETWVITASVWLIAIPCTMVYLRLRRERKRNTSPPRQETPGKRDWSTLQLYATAAALFAVVWVLFYSSFFTNFPQGVYDSVRTFGYWFNTSNSTAHAYGPGKYLEWLSRIEAPIMILGAAGVVVALLRATNRFAVFAAFWSLGIFSAYSLVHYKTPWLALNILLPFIITAGYGLEQLYRRLRPLAVGVVAVAAGVCLYQAIYVSFFHYDDNSQVYVYVHTQREFESMVNEINRIAAGNPAGKDIGITVMSPEHWPLPWYLRDYGHAGYWGKVVNSTEPIMIVHQDQVDDVDRTLGGAYRLIGSYDMRPGVRLYLYLRKGVQE